MSRSEALEVSSKDQMNTAILNVDPSASARLHDSAAEREGCNRRHSVPALGFFTT